MGLEIIILYGYKIHIKSTILAIDNYYYIIIIVSLITHLALSPGPFPAFGVACATLKSWEWAWG